MERLTKWIDDGETRQAIPDPEIRSNGHSKCCNKLAELEDLEKRGLLVRLPCKVGSNIYRITDDGIDVAECREITVADKEMYIESNTFFDWISFDEIGKTVFLTEAEAKLKELEESHDC